MIDKKKIIKGMETCYCPPAKCEDCPYHDLPDEQSCNDTLCLDALSLLKEQEADCFEPWDVLWKAPDGTFKGRCDNCGFVHVFIEGHVTQYKFCPQCGEQKQEL